MVEHGEVRYGLVGHSKAGEALNGGMGCVMVQYGWFVTVGRGSVLQGMVRQVRRGVEGSGGVW